MMNTHAHTWMMNTHAHTRMHTKECFWMMIKTYTNILTIILKLHKAYTNSLPSTFLNRHIEYTLINHQYSFAT